MKFKYKKPSKIAKEELDVKPRTHGLSLPSLSAPASNRRRKQSNRSFSEAAITAAQCIGSESRTSRSSTPVRQQTENYSRNKVLLKVSTKIIKHAKLSLFKTHLTQTNQRRAIMCHTVGTGTEAEDSCSRVTSICIQSRVKNTVLMNTV